MTIVSSDTNYNTVINPIDISSFVVGSDITVISSLMSTRGVYIADENLNPLIYINGNNASEYGYTENSIPTEVTLTVPINAKYIYNTIRTAYYTTVSQFAVTGYERNKIQTIEDNIDTIEANMLTSIETIGKNLYNPDAASIGLLQSNGTVNAGDSGYVTSDFIHIVTGQSVTTYARIRRFIAYDANKNVVDGSYVANATNTSYTYTAITDGYIKASFYANATVFQIEYGTEATTPQDYAVTRRFADGIYPSETLSRNIGNVLFGKKWVVVGDSFTEGLDAELIDNGEYKGYHGCYPYLIANRTGIKVIQFFRGGRTMAYPSGGSFTNSFCCPTDPWYYQNIPVDTDYLTIKLGINDVNHSSGSGTTPDGEDATGVITLGTIDDTETSTYYGAWNTVMTWLLNNRPFTHIGIIVTNGTQSEEWTNAQINIAKKYGVPYLNENGDQICRAMLRCYNPNIPSEIKELIKEKQSVDYDGTVTGSVNWHPNTYAHKLESTFIENFLRTL